MSHCGDVQLDPDESLPIYKPENADVLEFILNDLSSYSRDELISAILDSYTDKEIAETRDVDMKGVEG